MKLTGRGHNVIVNVLMRKTTLPTGERLDLNYIGGKTTVRWLDEYVDRSGPRVLKHALLAALDVGASSAYASLLLVRNCGVKSARELCTALGLWMPEKPHTCVCRHCGRKL